MPGRSNYFLGNDRAKWRRGIEQFGQVRVERVYSGIDLRYYGGRGALEYDYEIAPKGDPARIRLRVQGSARIHPGGDLLLSDTDSRRELLRLRQPLAYRIMANGFRAPVIAHYRRNQDGSFGFSLGSYNRALPLVIDPVITYSTYFGGNNEDTVNDVKADAAGNLYLLLGTASKDLPLISQIPNACSGACGAANPSAPDRTKTVYDFYLAKLDATGQTLLYSTYIGGSGQDIPGSFVIASDGTIYIAGATISPDFPLVHEYSSTLAPNSAYGGPTYSTTLTRLSADGSTILYSTRIGGGLVNAVKEPAPPLLTGEARPVRWPPVPTASPTCSGMQTPRCRVGATEPLWMRRKRPLPRAMAHSSLSSTPRWRCGHAHSTDSWQHRTRSFRQRHRRRSGQRRTSAYPRHREPYRNLYRRYLRRKFAHPIAVMQIRFATETRR